ncbi:MAG: hypothetical protein HRT89_19575 [Lentisphaeria bacterium]|nr:hypothetical protein [Lentisphaeria bacterium]NQZ70258.1 hypothetical protein [Lentisphaeria bacterium]
MKNKRIYTLGACDFRGIIHIASLLLLFVLPISSSAKDKAIDYQVQKTAVKPKIDGDLSDKAWANATFKKGLYYFSQKMYLKKEIAKPTTSFAILADHKNLYVAIRCEEPRIDAIKKTAIKHDSNAFQDDSIELFIDTDHSGDHYYQIALSVMGGLFDSVCINYGKRKRNDFNIKGIRSATKIHKDSWTAELAIPFAGLGVKPDDDGVWNLNVCRSTTTVEFNLASSSWGTKGKDDGRWKGFHDAKIFPLIGGIPKPKYSKSEMAEVKTLRKIWKLDVKPGPQSISLEAIHDTMFVANNLIVPNWFTNPIAGREAMAKNAHYYIEVPEGIELLAVGQKARIDADSAEIDVFAKNTYDISPPVKVTHAGSSFKRYKITPVKVHRSNRVIGPFYLKTNLKDGSRLPLFYQAVYDGGKQELQQLEILVKTFPTPGMPKKLLAVIHWMGQQDYFGWPDMLDNYEKLGFNSVPFNRSFVNDLYPQIKTFHKDARSRGMTVTAGLSPFHRLFRHKESQSVNENKKKDKYDLCPAYRGKHFWDEVRAVGDWSLQVGAEYVMLDVECYGNGALKGRTGQCKRCDKFIKKSGLDPKEAMIALGSEIQRETKKHLINVFKKAGKTVPPLAWYNSEPGGKVYTDTFRFDDTYKKGADIANPAIYYSMKALIIGERIRKIRSLMNDGDVMPHVTMGYLDAAGWEREFPNEWVYDQVLEIYGNGARGIGWFCYAKMEGADLYYYAKAMAAINPVAELIYDSEPVKGVSASGIYSATAIKKGNAYLILVSEYENGKPGKVKITLPVSVSGRLTDLSHKKELGKVNGKVIELDFKPGVDGAFTALYLIGN